MWFPPIQCLARIFALPLESVYNYAYALYVWAVIIVAGDNALQIYEGTHCLMPGPYMLL